LVADELRRRIQAGAIPPGTLLPSETTLIAQFAVSRGTIREALATLRAEGLVVTEHGRGTYARPALPVRRLAADRYRVPLADPLATSFTRDQGIEWSDYQLEREFRRVSASPELAQAFGVEPGTPVLERRFVFRSMGIAQQLSTSCLLDSLVAGTPVADPDNEPWPGGSIAQLASLGITVTSIIERVRARMPNAEESATLRLAGVPVLTITRRMYAAETVVEVAADIVLPGDRTELEYRIDLGT
jgi:GntR family transcriptional regulator